MVDERTPDEWGEVYRDRRRDFKALTAKIGALLPELLRHADLDVAHIEGRTKGVDSFVEKLVRKKGKYRDPLTEVTDLSGFRIITYYREDVDRVVNLLKTEFAMDEGNSEDKTEQLDADRFGYSSVHLVVGLGAGRASLPEWSSYARMKWEFQVRTVVQHAWAAVEHKLNYKGIEEVPRDLQRQLYRLSALFELADGEFSGLRTSIDMLKARYEEKVSEGDLTLALDADSLNAYLDHSDRVKTTLSFLAEAGLSILNPWGPGMMQEADRRDLLQALQDCGIETIRDLDETLEGLLRSQRGRVERFADEMNARAIYTTQDGALTWAVLAACDASVSIVRSIFTDEPTEAFRRAKNAW